MDGKLSRFIDSLEGLKQAIANAPVREEGFQVYGYNHAHLDKEHIENIISNYIKKLKSYESEKLPDGFSSVVDSHSEKLELLQSTVAKYLNNNTSHIQNLVPVIINTLLVIFSDVDYELFSFECISSKKFYPRSLSARLRSTKAVLDKLDVQTSDIQNKVQSINQAHEAAESLPTDLESLAEARTEVKRMISKSMADFKNTKNQISELKEEILLLNNEAKNSVKEIVNLMSISKQYSDEAEILVKECDDALQITTTQGLAAGFDQKAKELKQSIWIWIIGLLIALITGSVIGGQRVESFTLAVTTDLTAGQAILHSIMSIFSIGGPLWLAWISTQQITQRFKLSEDYAYKATVAKSFTGFKKFAERFDPSTEERLFNSTLDRLDEMPLRLLKNKDYSSPWQEFIDSDSFKSAISRCPELYKEAKKFATKADLSSVKKANDTVEAKSSQ